MTSLLALRREDKHHERRSPICPVHLPALGREGVELWVQPAAQRVFTEAEYAAAGAVVREDLSEAQVIVGLKEIDLPHLQPNATYAFFSHTIKGQAQNLPMLRRLLELGCTLVDYEKITDEHGRRTVFFGRYAGLAGMIDTLWAFGQRLLAEGIPTPLAELRCAFDYAGLDEASAALRRVGAEMAELRLPPPHSPVLIGITGDGNVSRGAQAILELCGAKAVEPDELDGLRPGTPGLFSTVFRRAETVEPVTGVTGLESYYEKPEWYRPIFERQLPRLSVLVNCIYWDERFPRLVTLPALRRLYAEPAPRLKVIGDLSCDLNGAIEATVRTTSPDAPAYVYDVATGETHDGVAGHGPVILAVYNLPAELPREASEAFGLALLPYLPALAAARYDATFEQSGLSPALRRATIAYRGELTPNFSYLRRHL